MRLGVFLPNWIGDVVMATPALRGMRTLVGDRGELIGIMRPYVADVLSGTNWFDQQIVYDKPARGFSVASREVYQSLRAARLDRIVLLTNSMRTAWLAWRSGARERIGYGGWPRSWLLTNCFKQPLTDDGRMLPTIDGYRHLVEAAGCEPTSRRLELATTDADEAIADALWRRLKLPTGERVVVLNAGSAFGAAKQWPTEHYSALARKIVDGGEFSVLVNCGPSEREIAREIVTRTNDHRVVSLADEKQLPIGLTKACVQRSRLLVTNDTGPRFFGVAFGRPVVTLFGPTDSKSTETHYDAETCLSLSLDCQPCMERTCPLVHHRCMPELSVDTVYRVVAKNLAQDSGCVSTIAGD